MTAGIRDTDTAASAASTLSGPAPCRSSGRVIILSSGKPIAMGSPTAITGVNKSALPRGKGDLDTRAVYKSALPEGKVDLDTRAVNKSALP